MSMRVTDDRLEIRLIPTEKVLGLLRDVDAPLSAVGDVEVVPNGLTATTGLRAPGYSWHSAASSAPGAARGQVAGRRAP
jgi:hypothetical protein